MEWMIRPVEAGDAQALAALRRMPGVFENTLGLPSARLEQSERFLQNLDSNQHQFVAVLPDGTVVGTCGLTVNANPRLHHSASVGLFVRTDWQGHGAGTAMLNTVLDLADHWLMLVRVELEVFSDNEGAIRLYESLGFEKEGLKRMATIRGGRYVDEYLMSRLRPGFQP